MKKIILLLMLFCLFGGFAYSQVVQSNFQSVLVPQYICSGTSTRLPYVYRATVSGLEPNTYYRYYTQACRYTDFGTTNPGAGNTILIGDTNFRFTSSPSLTNQAGYDSLLTNSSGSYTGWFGFAHTGNARFTAGNYLYPTIVLDSMGTGITKYRFALNDSILVLQFDNTSTNLSATGIYGVSLAVRKNIVSLYDNVNGTGRPLSVIYVENAGISSSAMSSLVQYYVDSVISRDGRWGSIIPNILPTGVRRINLYQLSTGALINYNVDPDGIWPSGANTVNPLGGAASPIRLDIQDAPLLTKEINVAGTDFSLYQNYPNPFNPATTIRFSVPGKGHCMLCVYNILGQKIDVLVDGYLESGTYNIRFNGSELGTGVYFYILNFEGSDGKFYSDKKKLILIR